MGNTNSLGSCRYWRIRYGPGVLRARPVPHGGPRSRSTARRPKPSATLMKSWGTSNLEAKMRRRRTGLLLVHRDQAEGRCSARTILTLVLLRRRDHLLDVHQDRTVAELRPRCAGLRPGRRRWRRAGRSPWCRGVGRSARRANDAIRVGLGHPHLVLADVGGHGGLRRRAGGNGGDQPGRRSRIVAARRLQRCAA